MKSELTIESSNLIAFLAQTAGKHEINHFLTPFLASLAGSAEYMVHWDELTSASMALPDAVQHDLASMKIAALLSVCSSSADSDEVIPGHIVQQLIKLKQAHPQIYESALAQSMHKESTARIVTAISQADHSSLGVRDASSSARLAAFKDQGQISTVSKEDLVLLLSDPSPEVAALLSEPAVAQRVLDLVPEEDVISLCLQTCLADTASRRTLQSHIAFLLSKFPATADRVLQALWPRLLITKSGRKTSLAVWEAFLTSDVAILKGMEPAQLSDTDSAQLNWTIAKQLAGLFRLFISFWY